MHRGQRPLRLKTRRVNRAFSPQHSSNDGWPCTFRTLYMGALLCPGLSDCDRSDRRRVPPPGQRPHGAQRDALDTGRGSSDAQRAQHNCFILLERIQPIPYGCRAKATASACRPHSQPSTAGPRLAGRPVTPDPLGRDTLETRYIRPVPSSNSPNCNSAHCRIHRRGRGNLDSLQANSVAGICSLHTRLQFRA